MKNLHYILLLLFLPVYFISSQTLNWDGFPAGGTSYTTGIMTVTVTSSSPGFQNGTPKYFPGNTVGNGQCGISGGLSLEHMFGNITNAHSTLTMDFTSGGTTNGLCGNISFKIKDINADESYQTFADWVELSATDGNNNPVPVANITASGGSNKVITTSGNIRIVKGYNSSAYGSRSSALCDEVTFTVTPPPGTTLKTVVLKYHPDYTAAPNDYYSFSGPKRPAYQYISISPLTVNATAGPTAVGLTITDASCNQNDGSVTIGNVTGGAAPYTFNFNGQGSSSQTIYTGLSNGTYPIIVQDNNGCVYNTNAQVATQAGPTAISVSTTPAACGQSNGTITLGTVTGGTAPYEYNVDGNGFSTTVSYAQLASGSHPIEVKDANGCTFSTSATVGTASGPTAISVSTTPAACGQSNGTITLGTVTGGTAPYEYNVDGNGFSSTISYAQLTSGSHSIEVKDANSCTYSTSVTVGIASGPTAVSVSTTPAACGQSNGTITLGTVTGGTAPYEYNVDGNGFSSTVSYALLASGSHSVEVKDANGCAYSTTATVGTASGPVAIAVSVTETACGQADGTMTVLNVTGGTAPYQYSVDGGSFSSALGYTQLSAGSHSVEVKDANGCTFTETFSIQNSNGPTAVAINTEKDSCGQGKGAVYLGTVTGGVAPYEYAFASGGFSSNTTYPNLNSGTYTVTVKDAAGCIYTTSAIVGGSPGITDISVTAVNDTCNKSAGSVHLGAVTGGTAPYVYDLHSSGFTSATSYSGLAEGTYPLIVADAEGCRLTKTVTVNNLFEPPYDMEYVHTIIGCGINGTLEITNVTGGTAPYIFNFNGNVVGAEIPDVPPGQAEITITDAAGCQLKRTVVIPDNSGIESLYIPHVFTPNGDNANDTWFITGNCVKELECIILNRWGEVMDTFDDITDQWDGTFKGKKAMSGVYFHKTRVTFYSGKTEEQHGHITLIDSKK